MPSLLPGYEYDIFISYRQKDNKGAKWVTTFVEALRAELEATFKEDLSIYFDENPHDGLLETHHVDKSLEGKLKCLIFIPIVSQTYCDTKSFAWTQEFCAFNKLAAEDSFGRDIKLSNGNVASRILPVRIHGLDARDQQSLETEIGSVLRSVEFIYREPGVNRPLSPDDDPSDNLNKTRYRNQVNKVANAIKDIIAGLQNFGKLDFNEPWLENPAEEVKSHGKSIVVLPFEDMSPEKDQAFFCEGMAEELINALTKIKDLHVVARTSAFSFKGKEHDAQKIGEKLNVESLLEGSVRKAGNRLRITVQLINVSDGFHLWSERFDREVADVFAIQDEIAMNVVEKLNVALAGGEKNMVMKHHTNNIEAHSSYLKGRYHGMMFTEDDRTKALENYTAAIEKDPQYALAYSGLADLHCMMGLFSTNHPEEMYLKAKGHAEKAIALDPRLGEAYQASASVKMFFERKWLDAGKDYQRALELSPGSAIVHINYAIHLMAIGKSEEAIAAGMRAISLDPLSSTVNQLFGFIYFALAQFDQAISQLRRALELNPGNAWAQVELGWSYGYKGMGAEARMEIEKAEEIKKEFDPWFCTTIACVFAMQGKKGMVEKALSQVKDFSRNNYVDPTDFAVLYAWLGDADEAFRWLEKGIKERAIHMYFVRNMSYLWLKPIASDPRYKNILDRIGLGGFVQSKTIDPIPPIAPAKSLIVLPFENMSPDKDNEYFSDGLTEEIIANLSKIKSLKVLSRTSSMHYKGAKKPLAQVAKELGVEYVLEGSVRKQGKDVRITVQLIDAGQDVHLWTEIYDRRLKDIFAIQSDIALRVGESLRVSLTKEEKEIIQGQPTESVEAYDYYLLGQHHWFRFTEEGSKKAGEFFSKALMLDPDFAQAHAGLANTYLMWGGAPLNILPASDAMPIAKREAEYSIKLNPNFGDAYEALALIQCWFEWDWKAASETAKKGTEVDPNSAAAWAAYGLTLGLRGEHDDAIRAVARALELDPLSGIFLVNATEIHFHARKYDLAKQFVHLLLELLPNFPPGVGAYCQILLAEGKNKEAYTVIEPVSKVMESYDYGMAILALAMGRSGHKMEAVKLAKKLELQCLEGRASWADVALAYLGVGDSERAFEFLEKVPDQRPAGGLLTAYLGVSPLFDSIRHDIRYQHVLQRLGFPQSILSLPSGEALPIRNEKSIVVLPFENMSSDKDNEYFSDGLTGEIIADLSQAHALRVISRNSAMTFKGSHKKTKEIASELNVDYILEGSVRKSGNDLRITAQLVNAIDDAPVWTERYVGDLQDIFAIQEKVSRAIVSALRLSLTIEESDKLGARHFKDARTYELYQMALYEFYFFKDESLKRSITYLESALKFEGESSFLLTKLGFVYCNLFNFSAGLEDSSPYLTKAKQYADRIFQLEGQSTHWHSLMGFIGFYGGHISDVLRHLRSTQVNAFETDDLWLVVLGYSYLGLMDKAQEHIEEMEQRDPLNAICPVLASLVCYMSHGSERAFENSKSAYIRYPDIPQSQLYYAYHLAARESNTEAQAIIKKFIAGSADTIFAPIGTLFLCGLERREPSADLIPDDSAAKLRLDCEWSWLIADFYSFAGKNEESLDWLQHAVNHGFVNYPLLATLDPYLKNVRGEERFKKILEVAKDGWEAARKEFGSEIPNI